MMKAVTIDRTTGDGKYGDVLDAAAIAANDYGSAANAIVQMARESDIYKAAMRKVKAADRQVQS